VRLSDLSVLAAQLNRDFLARSFPETFSVPDRYEKHMMIVADLENGNADAIEDAVVGAWELQSRRERREGLRNA